MDPLTVYDLSVKLAHIRAIQNTAVHRFRKTPPGPERVKLVRLIAGCDQRYAALYAESGLR